VLTVTVPDQELLDRLADLSDRVELVLWDLLSPLPPDVAERVRVVQIGHYWAAPDRWVRLYEAPNLEYVMLPSAGFEHAIPRVPPGTILCNGRGRGCRPALCCATAAGCTRPVRRSWRSR